MKNKNVGASIARPKRKIINKIKIVIAVSILLLLLLTILLINRNKLFKKKALANNEYNVTIAETEIDISNVITSEPNPPIVGAGMIPIKWNGKDNVWEITSKEDPNWYNYSEGKTANIMLSDR